MQTALLTWLALPKSITFTLKKKHIMVLFYGSVVDPHQFQCESGYGSGYRKPNKCGSRQIRILVRLLGHKRLNFYMKNILQVGNRSKNIVPTKVQKPF